MTRLTVTGLIPFSVYGVTVLAVNADGEASVPSVGVKVVTHVTGDARQPDPQRAPDLPDTVQCCVGKNVTDQKCLDTFCSPLGLSWAGSDEMERCAGDSDKMFSCLTDARDHRSCCARRGVPASCLQLCSDSPPRVDVTSVQCYQHMSDMASCLLEHYNVLPSAPVNFRYSNPNPSFVILHWSAPAQLGDTVLMYELTVQMVSPRLGPVLTYSSVESPHILEHLEARSTYEVYVKPVNEYGVGEPSSRLVFRTTSIREDEYHRTDLTPHNMTECCLSVGVSHTCRALCSWGVEETVMRNLTQQCEPELSKILRCGTGGRDHMSCCRKRYLID